jgi:protein-S-isoprenylcysteine O-methyltransferase Ste14
MEPLDTDIDYMVRTPGAANPDSRFNVILVMPVLGILLLLIFAIAAIFQINLSDLIDSLMGLLLLLFFVLIALLFWAMAPRVRSSSHGHE